MLTSCSDAQIQATIRTEFKASTVVVIAHRLHSIMDCDVVMVMDSGMIVESGSPIDLLKRPQGAFSKLVAAAGPQTEAHLKSLAGKQSAWI